MRTKVQLCGVDTSTLPILSHQEMTEKFRQYQAGNLAVRDELIYCNLRLVLSLVSRFSYRGEMADDLFQVGCIGLIKAIENFDLKHNVRFSTYAVPMILGEIRRHLRDHHSVRVSRSLRDIAYKALQAKEAFITKYLKEPTIEQISEEIDIKKDDILFALDAVQDPLSLNEPIYSDSGEAIYMMDQLKDSVNEEQWVSGIALKESVENLSKRQQLIVARRYYMGQTQTEIAMELGLSQAQISRLEKSALANIQKQYE